MQKIDKEEKPEYPTKEIIDAKRHIKQIDKKEDGYLRKPKIEMYEPVKFYIDNSGLVLIAAFILGVAIKTSFAISAAVGLAIREVVEAIALNKQSVLPVSSLQEGMFDRSHLVAHS